MLFGWLSLPWYFNQLPFILYFLISLQELPLDLAIVRFLTCYLLPISLWWTFSQSILLGLFFCVVLWIFFTKPTAYATIRIPSGALRKNVRSMIQHDKFKGILKYTGNSSTDLTELVADDQQDDLSELVNPFAAYAFVEIVHPIIQGVNLLEFVVGGPKRAKQVIKTSEVNWLFSQINNVGKFTDKLANRQILWPSNSNKFVQISKQIVAGNIMGISDDHTYEGIRLFFRDLQLDRNPLHVSATGRLLLQNFFTGLMTVRKNVVDYLQKNPTIVNIPVVKPIIIVGLPRTGSTFLQYLLAQDPNSRHIRLWEINIPIPPPREATYTTDPRIILVEKGLGSAKVVDSNYMEGLRQHHNVSGPAVEEELLVLYHTMLVFSQYYLCGDNEYKAWMYREDNKEYSYRYFRRFLQVLGSKYRPRSQWILKCPMHTLYLDALMKEFPDTRLIFTHRSPENIIPSWSQFQAQMLRIYTEVEYDITPQCIQETKFMISEMAQRILRFREKNSNPEQMLDINFEELVSDPIGTVKNIYEHYKIPFTEEYEEKLRAYIKHGEKEGKTKAQKLTLKDVGLTKAQIDEEFSEYIKTFIKKDQRKKSK